MATLIDASVMGAQLLPDEAHSDFVRTLLEQLDTEERIAPYTLQCPIGRSEVYFRLWNEPSLIHS